MKTYPGKKYLAEISMWNDCGLPAFEAFDNLKKAEAWLVGELEKAREWIRAESKKIKDASDKLRSSPALACIYRLDQDGETDCHPDDIVESLL